MIVLSVTVEVSDQIGKTETRICGVFETRDLAQQAQIKTERLIAYRTRRTTYKMTEVELNQAADFGAA